MAAGRLGTPVTPAANTNEKIYTVPVGVVATVNVSLVNRGATPTKVRIAIATTDSPSLSEYIEYDETIRANGVLERTGIVCSAGERVIVRADTANLSARAHGFEE